MPRTRRILLRVALVSIVGAPWVSMIGAPRDARADALPGNPDDIYYHCTPEEQCPTGSETCPATIGPAGQRPVEPKCAEAATAKKLERRCWGRSGHLYCPAGVTGTWKAKAPPAPQSKPEGSEPKRGC